MSTRGMKRSGRFMRGSSSSGGPGAGNGIGGGNNDDQQGDDEEDEEQSGQPVFVTGVVMRRPSVPHDYVKTDYMKRGMTATVRKERKKNPLNMRKGRSIEYRFQTKFHQDFYESAILSKKYKKDYHPGPTLAQVIQARQQDATQGDDDEAAPDAAPHFPSAPRVPSRSHSRRGGSREMNWEKPPSLLRRMFNLIFGMCKSTNDVVHKERQRRKKDTLRFKKMPEVTLPNDPPSPIGSEKQQSEPEDLE
ncbi:hypothetical protein C2845_PM11G27140 [Panicum miliaceum]|uniref:Uncharacterized protein n=1 Tax=Panicum miliaceum TaxID=4540 RepID=A0A3L6RS30_PANMI|nr:hypothetical protein C2845_PM11G27140 [Panicum miliaceum]